MGETPRFEQSPREQLQDDIHRLEQWLREELPSESAEEMISSIETVLQEAKDRKDNLAEFEGTVARLKNEVSIKNANLQLDRVPKSRIEEGPEKRDASESHKE